MFAHVLTAESDKKPGLFSLIGILTLHPLLKSLGAIRMTGCNDEAWKMLLYITRWCISIVSADFKQLAPSLQDLWQQEN